MGKDPWDQGAVVKVELVAKFSEKKKRTFRSKFVRFGRTREIWKHESFGTRPKHVLKFNETENSISKPLAGRL